MRDTANVHVFLCLIQKLISGAFQEYIPVKQIPVFFRIMSLSSQTNWCTYYITEHNII